MRRTASIWSWVALACAAMPPAGAKNLPRRIPPMQTGVEVKVAMKQIGNVPKDVEDTAETTAGMLFRRIGVTIRFTNEPPHADTISVRVWERAPDGLNSGCMGFARLIPGYGSQANAFYDRAKSYSPTSDTRETGTVLGYVIAHELGHVLRGEPGHTDQGIMKGRWSPFDAMLMTKRAVSFSHDDAERILSTLAREKAGTAPQ